MYSSYLVREGLCNNGFHFVRRTLMTLNLGARDALPSLISAEKALEEFNHNAKYVKMQKLSEISGLSIFFACLDMNCCNLYVSFIICLCSIKLLP